MTATFLTGASLLVRGAWLPDHGVLIEGTRIAAVLPHSARPEATHIALPPGTLLSPGLIDLQVNGGGLLLLNDQPDQATARAIAAAHRRLGTTSILPTLITDTPQAMRAAATIQPEPGILGLHFEGPFISPDRPGVHRPDLIRPPTEADLAFLETLARTTPILLTVAPETVPDAQLARLRAAGITLSAGHSAASFERTTDALAAGITGFTHLFNAMPPLAARAPGIAAAALTHPTAWCGIIADGIHVHPAMLRLLLATKPRPHLARVGRHAPHRHHRRNLPAPGPHHPPRRRRPAHRRRHARRRGHLPLPTPSASASAPSASPPPRP